MYYTYILKSTVNGAFYKGHTDDLKERIRRHNKKLEKFTASYTPWDLVWFGKKETKSEAAILELKLKNLSVKRTVEFIKKYPVAGGPDDAELIKILKNI
jgi:putative endonuclease